MVIASFAWSSTTNTLICHSPFGSYVLHRWRVVSSIAEPRLRKGIGVTVRFGRGTYVGRREGRSGHGPRERHDDTGTVVRSPRREDGGDRDALRRGPAHRRLRYTELAGCCQLGSRKLPGSRDH